MAVPLLAVCFALGANAQDGKAESGNEKTLKRLTLEPFEGKCSWTPYRWNTAKGSHRLQQAAIPEGKAGQDGSQPASAEALEMLINFTADRFQWYIFSPPEPVKIAGKLKRISFRIKGTGTKHYVELHFFDRRGMNQKLKCGSLTQTDWQEVEVVIPNEWAQPLSLKGLCIHNWQLPDPVDLVVHLDQLEAVVDPSYDFKGFSNLDEIDKRLATGAKRDNSFGSKELDRQSLITEATTQVRRRQPPKEVDVYFGDDFMRNDPNGSSWRPRKGDWKIASIYDSKRFDPRLSANAFCYHGRGKPLTATVIAKDTPDVAHKGPQAVLRISPTDNIREGMEFVSVNPLTDEMTGEALLENVYVLIKLKVVDVAGANAVCDMLGDDFLWDSLKAGSTVYLDPGLRYEGGQHWMPAEELKQLKQNSVEAMSFTGYWFWRDYAVNVAVKALGDQGFGLYLCYLDKDNYYYVSFPGQPGAKTQLVKCVGGKTSVLAEKDAYLQQGVWYRASFAAFRGRVIAAIDSHLVFDIADGEVESGKFGLHASGERGAYFDDVAARSVPPSVTDTAGLLEFLAGGAPTLAINKVFSGADTMENWAGLMSDWEIKQDGRRRVVWNRKDFYGRLSLSYPLADIYKKGNTVGLMIYGDGQNRESGYTAVLDWASAGDGNNVSLYRAGELVASVRVKGLWDAEEGEIKREDGHIVVGIDGENVLQTKDTQPLNHTRIGVWSTGEALDPSQVEAYSDRMHNYVFSRAAVDWRSESGLWRIANRWSCSPQWSWLGGESAEVAALWHKREFRGDMTLDFYAAPKMGSASGAGVIETAADMNISLCADGRNPDSGYSFVYGGWRNTFTRILRKGQSVAETRDVLPPSWRDSNPLRTGLNNLHRRWFHFTVVKKGPIIRYYVDNELALQYDDPEPLNSGRVCIWTVRNGLMLARARISYSEEGPWEVPLTPNPPAEELQRSANVKGFLEKLGVYSPTHPISFDDFNHTLGKWQTVEGSQSARLSLIPRGGRPNDRALHLTNVRSGGHFDARCISEPFDALKQSLLSFDYRVPPGVLVNFYLTVNGQKFCVVFTGAPDELGDATTIGEMESVEADNEWRHATFNLKHGLLPHFPGAKTLTVQDLVVGCFDEDRYLSAGFGGNRAGAAWSIDNFYLGAPGSSKARFVWWERKPIGIKDLSYILDTEANTVPDDEPEHEKKLISRKNLKSGTHYFHLRGRKFDGDWTDTTHYRIDVDAEAPRAEWQSPDEGARWYGSSALVKLTDAQHSDIDPQSIELRLVRESGETFNWSVADRPVSFELATGMLKLSIVDLPFKLKDGEKVKVALTQVGDTHGNRAERPVERNWTVDRQKDLEPPVLTVRTNIPYLRKDDFEADLGQWSGPGNGAFLSRDPKAPAGGRYSLKAFNRRRGAFAITAISSPFSAGKYPVLTFDYRLGVGIHTDLILNIDRKNWNITFTDNDGVDTALGTVPGAVADGKWHHCEVNLLAMLRDGKAAVPSYLIQSLGFSDTGYAGNARGDTCWFDNFELTPVVSTKLEPIKWHWTAVDASGVEEYQWSFTSDPERPEWHSTQERQVSLPEAGVGERHFLLRARDTVGNWSDLHHQRVFVDDKLPVCGEPSPADQARAAVSSISVPIEDANSGIDLDRSWLAVSGRKYTFRDPSVEYDIGKGILTWRSDKTSPAPTQFADGQKVEVALAAYDHAGNGIEKTWSWHMDYKTDRTGPPAPYAAAKPATALLWNDFEESAGTWKPYAARWRHRGDPTVVVERTQEETAGGAHSLVLRNNRENGTFATTVYSSPKGFDALEYPILSFDYRLQPGVKLDLMVKSDLNLPWKGIAFTDDDNIYRKIGRVEGVVADGKWHHLELDLGACLTRDDPKATKQIVKAVALADYGVRTNPLGACMWVDNFAISKGIEPGEVTFSWPMPADPTGVDCFSYSLDQQADSSPEQPLGRKTTAVLKNVKPGDHVFHLRARDRAGNWGETKHYRLKVRGRKTPGRTESRGKPKPASKLADPLMLQSNALSEIGDI